MTETRRAQKIAIIGFTDHRKQAPFSNPDWKIWGLNDLYMDLPPIPNDRLSWFQVHSWHERGDGKFAPLQESIVDFGEGPPHPRDPNHVAWLRDAATKIPLYMMEARPEVPDAIVIDKERVLKYFEDGYGQPIRYVTNSISWMIALAIMELAPDGPGSVVEGAEIGIWGVDMMMGGGPGSEYGYQRPSCEFFIAWARGLGIKVVIPVESDLCKTAYLYGEGLHNPYRKRLIARRKDLSRQRGEYNGQMSQLQMAIAEVTGAIDNLDWQLRSWMPSDGTGEAFIGVRSPEPGSNTGATMGVMPGFDEGMR